MLPLILTLVIIFGVAWGCFVLVDRAGTPYPFNLILKIIIGIIAVFALLTKSGLLAGTGLA